jgi:DNA end-binding protein Ku
VIDSLVAEFDPDELQSTYRRDLRALLESKLDGQPIAKPEVVPDAPVIDLMEALRASVAQASKAKKKPAAEKTARPRTKAAAGGSRKK